MMYDLISPSDPPRRRFTDTAAPSAIDDPLVGAWLLARMLDAVPNCMLLVQDDGVVVFANLAARRELDEFHPLQLLGRELRVRRPQDVAPLREALHAASRKGLQRMLTLGDAGTETVTLSVTPASEAAIGEPAGSTLVFGKRNVFEDLSVDAFARHHNLTPAEARVLKQLCAGRRPSDVAREQGVALCTVRSQIGSIREKTGAADIGALVMMVAKLPPLMMRKLWNALRAAA